MGFSKGETIVGRTLLCFNLEYLMDGYCSIDDVYRNDLNCHFGQNHNSSYVRLGLCPCVATGALKCITMLVPMCHYIGTNP